ncbi:hypothetical protein ACHAWU_003507 [Discostella pseudostelligera]|uniref:Uncharacterized protein n=1 Tax=Discostella pseudostelligera TaxID=259834 RepID=A0ABD3M3J2_9STRA
MFVHKLFIQPKYIRWFAIWDFVGAEPFANGGQGPREKLFYVIDVVEEWAPFILGIDCDDFPVGFAFVNHAENPKYFDGTDFLRDSSPIAWWEEDRYHLYIPLHRGGQM